LRSKSCSSGPGSGLRRGATEKKEVRWVDELEANARVYIPGVGEWRRSGELLSKLRRKHRYDARRIRDLHFDTLIALTARALGAVLITSKGADFREIREFERYELEVW
jgi:predicted nucleic acid-binding protein